MKTKFTKEEQEDLDIAVEQMEDIYAFENYCGACDNFDDPDNCPFYNKVTFCTRWESIKCNKFWD